VAALVKKGRPADPLLGWALAHQEGPTVMPQQISVSTTYQTCTNPVSLGYCTVLQGTWNGANNAVSHPQATPLKCVCDEDIASFKLKINSLPSTFVVWCVPQGPNYTSTATISANTIRFTLPTNVGDEEYWQVNIDDPATGGVPPCQIWVKLKRTTS
jgi:hypothetical protein